MTDYSKILENASRLPWIALVTIGRAGSDFFQSLLDSHPEVFVFNGHLQFHAYWKCSYCAQVKDPEPEDIADEFIGHFIFKLKSRYDLEEKKHKLGWEQNESLSIRTKAFREHLIALLRLRHISTRNILQAVYMAYALSRDEDIEKKKIFLHHQHNIWNLPDFLNDFPECSVISMTRDPRALWVSGVENWRRYTVTRDNAAHHYAVLKRAVEDATDIHRLGVKYTVLKLEDLGDENVLRNICRWMGIDYHPCMKYATWGGLKWWGDSLSAANMTKENNGFSKKMVENDWKRKLQWSDKFLLSFFLTPRLKQYNYPVSFYGGILAYIISPLLILLPTTYERRFLSPSYLLEVIQGGRIKDAGKSFYYYVKRIILFYRLFYQRICRRIVCSPLIANSCHLVKV